MPALFEGIFDHVGRVEVFEMNGNRQFLEHGMSSGIRDPLPNRTAFEVLLSFADDDGTMGKAELTAAGLFFDAHPNGESHVELNPNKRVPRWRSSKPCYPALGGAVARSATCSTALPKRPTRTRQPNMCRASARMAGACRYRVQRTACSSPPQTWRRSSCTTTTPPALSWLAPRLRQPRHRHRSQRLRRPRC